MYEVTLLGILVTLGVGGGALLQRAGLPRVTGYVLVGVLFSHGLLGAVLPMGAGAWTEELTGVALGLIAYVIGGSISVGQLRRSGASLSLTALGEALLAVVLTAAAVAAWLFAAGPDAGIDAWGIPVWKLALCLGAIAASTAPAATVAVIHQYRARGTLTSTLMALVAADDLLGIVLFSIAIAVSTGAGLVSGMEHAIIEISASMALGAAAGVGLGLGARRHTAAEFLGPAILGALLLVVGLAGLLGLSPLLAAITAGFCARLTHGASAEALFAPVEKAEELIFVVFFTVAGLHFDAAVFAGHLDLIAVYVLARGLGKYTGAALGARLGGLEPRVYRWLGLTLLPQAGIAIGLALGLAHQAPFRQVAPLVINVILGATMIHELAGPLLARFALARAGEVTIENTSDKRRHA